MKKHKNKCTEHIPREKEDIHHSLAVYRDYPTLVNEAHQPKPLLVQGTKYTLGIKRSNFAVCIDQVH